MFEGIRSLFNRILNPVEKTEPAPQQQQQTTNNQDMNEVIIIDVLAGKDEENRKFVGNDLLLNEMGKLKFSRYEDEERERPLQTIGEPTAYKVKSGDTLSHIADNHGVDLDAIIDANPKINPNMLKVGQELVIPAPVVKVATSDMEVDPKKTKEYESAIQQMMKEKGVTDTKQIKELSALITKKAIEQKVDPVLIAGIVGQEVDFRYLNDNIYGKNGKGMMQLTSVSIEDLYRNECPSYYIGSKDKLAEIKKKYPTANSPRRILPLRPSSSYSSL